MGMLSGIFTTQRSRRLLCVLLTLALVLPMLPVSAGAVSLTDRVAVEITTGEAAGDRVVFLGLNYLDTYGQLHVEYLFPQKDGLTQGFDHSRNLSVPEEIRRQHLTYMGLESAWGYGDQKALQSYSTDTFVFELPYEIDQDDPNWFQGLEVYCEGEPGGAPKPQNWDVQGLRIYTGGGTQMCRVGSVEGEYVLRPYGRRAFAMMEQGGGESLSWSSDTLFEFSTGSHADVPMTEDGGMVEPENVDEYYTVRIDFADVYGGGIEALAQAYQGDRTLSSYVGKEALVMEIQYTDIWGDVIRVNIPVLNSVLATLNTEENMPGSAISTSFEDLKLLGWAQQGETVAFTACLPDLAKITRVSFFSGTAAQSRTDLTMMRGEDVSITSVSVYSGRADGTASPDGGNSVLVSDSDGNDLNDVFTFRDRPIFYHTATSYSGETISADSAHAMAMSEYNAGSNLTPVNNNERYLVELKASDIGFYDTPEDIYLKIKYRTVKGEQRETSKISIRNAVSDFYGYWPASSEDFAYKALMYQEGDGKDFGGVKFIVELRDVDYFTGVVIDTGNGNGDWQMEGLQVSRLEDVSVRIGQWEHVSMGDVRSDRSYTRSTYGDIIFTMNETVLVQPGEDQEMDFTSGSVVESEEVDWSEVKYAMTFDESCADLGFTKSRETYTVEVKVSGETTSLDGNGDNGSDNQFFFQLEFEGGNSGYVLANQQLGSDGFRSGYNETFTITTNRDYGELVAVSIIPDDTSEDSDVYDKLNIEQIKVRRNTTDSITRQWTVSEVGWIGIDYHDEGAGVSIGGQNGRTEAEIARVYPVTYGSYGINLACNINTGSYESDNKEANTNAFYGTINATLWYTNSMGEMVSQSFDLVEEVYKYANRDPVYGVDETGKGTSAINDMSYMFRANHTDRFFLSVDDVVEINRLELNVTSLTGGSWTINNVAIQQVLSDGVLQISDNDEYVRTNETKPLCANITEDGHDAVTLRLPKGERQTYTIYFPENRIEVDEENYTWVSTVSREPASQNDELNIYIYPADTISSDCSLDVSVTYTNAYGVRWRTGAEDINRYNIDGTEVFSIQGLSASGISSLNSLTLKSESGREVLDAYIDHAVVQQVRSGVVINSYYINCAGQNAFWGFTAEPGTKQEISRPEQVVTFALGELTESANLLPEVRDIAVALRYTSVNESSGREYQSKYVFLTDQDYVLLESGDMISLTFNEEYLGEVTGITLVSTGGVMADVLRANVGIYTVAEGASDEQTVRKRIDWYSFADGALLYNSSATLVPTPEREVQPLKIDFTTAQAGGAAESGTNSPVSMYLSYYTSDGSTEELYVDDLRMWVTSQGSPFQTASVTTVEMLVADMAQLRWMELEPYDESETKATLKLAGVCAMLGENGGIQIVNRTLTDDVVFEEDDRDPHRINLSDISVEFTVRAINPDTGDYDDQSHRVKSSGVVLQLATKSLGGAVIDDIEVIGSDPDAYNVTTELVAAGGGVSTMDHLTEWFGGQLHFTAPENKTNSSMRYRITIASDELPSVAAVVEIEVIAEPTSMEDIVKDIINNLPTAGTTGAENGEVSADGTQTDASGTQDGSGTTDVGGAADSGADTQGT